MEPAVLPLSQGSTNTAFQQDNDIPYVSLLTLNSLIGFYIRLLANSPEMNQFEHPWDLIGHDMNPKPLMQGIYDQGPATNMAWQRLPQATINT
ncbi:hypothetical protein TNCV_2800751 [Trichonephila clavipes]|nr:hypothetical protein TNCV_2800751 [Trichonephila clavipes]